MFTNQIRSEIVIEGSAEEVWSVLADFGSYGAWNPGMNRVEGEPRVGSRLVIRFTPVGRRAMTIKPVVTVVEPERELRWLGRLLIPGLFDGEHRFELHPDGSGSVRFVQSERFKGLLVPFVRRMIEVDTVATFEAVNQALADRVSGLRVAGPA